MACTCVSKVQKGGGLGRVPLLVPGDDDKACLKGERGPPWVESKK
jgi:hypothetical protein